MAEKLVELNNQPLSADGTQSRASLFAEYEKPKLQALPIEPFEIGRWLRFRLGDDYKVCIDGVPYSVPFGLIGMLDRAPCAALTPNDCSRAESDPNSSTKRGAGNGATRLIASTCNRAMVVKC